MAQGTRGLGIRPPTRSLEEFDARTGPTPNRAFVVALTCGVVAGLVLYVVLATGFLPRPVSALLFGLAILGTPSADSIAKRVSLNGALFVGWTPLLWLVRLPFGINDGALVLSCWCGALIAWRLGGRTERLLRCKDPVRGCDALLVVAAVAALAALGKWWTAATPSRALQVMLPGWDNHAHFSMFAQIRADGVMLQGGPRPSDGSGWAYADYPQGFHALLATISEIAEPSRTGPELATAYVHSVAAVAVLGIVILTGAMLSLPGVRERVGIAAPAVVLAWTALLWEPGQKVLADGFANFWVAALAAASALLLGISASNEPRLSEVAAVMGLLIAIGLSWLPMVVIAGPAALALFVKVDRSSNRRRVRTARDWARVGTVVVAASVILWETFGVLSTVPVSSVVSATGGVRGASLLPTIAFAVCASFFCLASPRWPRTGASIEGIHMTARRVRVTALAPLAGAVMLIALLTLQLVRDGTTSYYFVKLFLGYELTMAPFAAGLVAMLMVRRAGSTSRTTVSRIGSTAAVLVCPLLLAPLPSAAPELWQESGDGTAELGASSSRANIVSGILSAAASTTPDDALKRDYVALGADRAGVALVPNLWFHALTHSESRNVALRGATLLTPGPDVGEAPTLISGMLRDDAGLVVVVDPKHLTRVRQAIEPALRSRVTGWD